MNLDDLLNISTTFLDSTFCITPEETTFKAYTMHEWENFKQNNGCATSCSGVYMPRTLSAHFSTDAEFAAITFLHEYFGHGLYCEYSLIGKKIVELEKELERIEKEVGGSKIDSTNSKFDEYKNIFNELSNFSSRCHNNYEGTAVWIEEKLSKVNGLHVNFERRLKQDGHASALLDGFHELENARGELGLFYSLGFPKFYDGSKVVGILQKMLGSKFSEVDLALLHGSQRPYSDIDIFVVSDNLDPIDSSWLDMRVISHEELSYKLSMLDIETTDPLFSGELIIGDAKYLEQLRLEVSKTEITEEIINYNCAKSQKQGEWGRMYPENSEGRLMGSRYEESYRANAEALARGKKMLVWKKRMG